MIYLASDHAGWKLKNKLVSFLKQKGYDIEDKGPFSYDKKDDYPDYIKLAAEEVSKNKNAKAIIFGYSGQGEAITANKYSEVRAVVYYKYSQKIIKLAREHNNANVLSIGAGFLNEKRAKKSVIKFLETSFTDELRHKRRINKIKKIEDKNFK